MVSDFIRSVVLLNTTELHQEMHTRFYDPLTKKDKSYTGADGMTVGQYRKNHFSIIQSIQRQICTPSRILDENGNPKTPTRFVYTPFLQFEVPKKPKSKEKRKLSKASIKNIVAQKMIAKFITPILDERFIEHSYAYRPKKSAKQALIQVQKLIGEGYIHILDADISKFFDNVRHDLLLDKVQMVFPGEPELCHLIYRFIKTGWIKKHETKNPRKGKIRQPVIQTDAGNIVSGNYYKRYQGIPQGGILSGLLANLYLNDFDHALLATFLEVKYIRYADDFLVFSRSLPECHAVCHFVGEYLSTQLGLELNPAKTKYRQVAEPRLKKSEPFVDFLGYRICANSIKIQPKNVQAYKNKMTAVINQWLKSNELIGSLIHRLNRKIEGRLYEFPIEGGSTMVCKNWTAYFSLISGHGQLKELDDWLFATVLKAIKAKNIPSFTRQTLRSLKLKTLVRLHYKMRQEKSKRFNEQVQQLKLPLLT